ncbi:MAG: NAD-dependent epimerase/dehydratase family protein [Candidatus Omnitrophota bacterium]
MNILITGGTGFVGRRLIERLHTRHSLAVISRSNKKAIFLEGSGVKVYYGDISDKNFVLESSRGADCVIHLAATFAPGKAMKDNLIFMRNVISAALGNGIKKLIFMSSINSKFGKQGPYSLSKRLCEEEVLRSGLDYVILRPGLIYDDRGGIFISQLLKFIKKFNFAPIIGTGEYRMQPIHVDDVVSITEKVLFSHRERTYDLFGPDIFTYNLLAEMIFDKLSVKKRVKIHIPLGLLRLIGPFFNITNDKILEIDENKTGDPEALRREFGIPLVELKTRLNLIINNLS